MADIKLRIVGIYFNTTVTIDDTLFPNGISVKDVLDTYVALHPVTQVGGLAYSVKQDFGDPTARPYESVLSFTHHYGGRFDFNGNGVTTDTVDGPTLSGSERDAGFYKLQEGTIPGVVSGVLGWQYYVEDGKGLRKSATIRTGTVDKGFDFFGEVPADPAKRLAHGDTITWRLVAILLGPTIIGKAPRILQQQEKNLPNKLR